MEPITQGLTTALEQLAARTETVFGMCCQLEYQQFVESQDNVLATHLFRIAQEAVANAVNHGKPRRVLIGLQQSNGQSIFTVSDDGIGIPGVIEYSRGMGLHMMKYRAEMIGGALDIRRQDGGGTIVTCSFQTQENWSGAKP